MWFAKTTDSPSRAAIWQQHLAPAHECRPQARLRPLSTQHIRRSGVAARSSVQDKRPAATGPAEGAPPDAVSPSSAEAYKPQQQPAVAADSQPTPFGPTHAPGGEHHGSSPVAAALRGVLARVGLTISDRTCALVLLNFTVLLYASNWVVVKDEGANFDPFAFALMRFAIATAALSPFLQKAAKDPLVVRAGVEVGAFCTAGYLLQSLGLAATDASRASFLATFTVIVVPILAGMTGRGVKPLTWASALGAFAGMAMLEGSGTPPSLGDAWSFLSACAFGAQVFRTEHWSRRLGAGRALPLISVVIATTCAGALLATVASQPDTALQVLADPALVVQAALDGRLPVTAALYTGLVSTTACLVVEVFALRDVTSTEAAIIYSLEPVLGAAFAYALLGERWGPLGWAGAALIIVSSLATQLYGGQERVSATD